MAILFNATLNGIVGLIIVFIACDLGQRMNDAFDEINCTLNRFDWYLFPIEIQRMLPMIKANTQKPVSLECFGSIACNREVFRKVGNDYSTIKSSKQSSLICFLVGILGFALRLFVFYGSPTTWRLECS